MPKKKSTRKPMKSLAQKFPKVTIKMALEQVYGYDNPRHEVLIEEIESTIKGSSAAQATEEVNALIKNVHPNDPMTAQAATTAIFTALRR